MPRFVTALACLGTGVLMAAALPPWGWWPLAFAGLAGLDRLIADRPRGRRFRRGALVGLGLYIPSLAWMTDMTVPGYLIAAVAYAALLGAAVTVVPASAPGRWIALPGAVALAELLRWSWPFGGVPLSSLAVGQVAGPLAPSLRLGGSLLLVEVTVVVGIVVAAALARRWRAAAVAALVVAAVVGGAVVAPRGEQVGELRVALVQGGGPQGTRAWNTDEREVFERHLEASDQIETPVDLVVWPEDVVDVDALRTADEGEELAELARELDAPVIAGVVEDAGPENFLNASVALDADGEVVDRYDKVHRVPFGEYVPLRSIIEPFGGESLTARDAVIGDEPALLETPAGRLSVAISWEIFFGDRVREGVADGAEVVLNPTNGSSFTGTLVQTQQVASSRMRAIESDRWLVQVAPTGFSAVIGPDGTVHQRSAVSQQVVLQDTVGLREGTTLYTRLGYGPAVALAVVCLALGWAVARRPDGAEVMAATVGGSSAADAVERAPSDLDDERDRAVVDEGDPHVGAEASGRHASAEPL
ncbi:MAG: apolipoprotein N-acyltransferase [Acidimicrobiales bacterium]|nr:apolipoprotein N-acyltransferase [Acidimicrobiales bacterium]